MELGSSAKNEMLNSSVLQTPRRSARKSVKPAQDYCEIILSKSRSTTNKENELLEETDELATQPKWTPAKVGRVSQKRGRKNKRSTAVGKTNEEQTNTLDIQEEKQNNTLITIEAEKNIELPVDVAPKGTDEEKTPNKEENTKSDTESITKVDDDEETTKDVVIFEHITADDVSPVKQASSSDNSTIMVSPDDGVDIAIGDTTDATQNNSTNTNTMQSAGNAKDSAIELCASDTSEHFGTYLKTNKMDMTDLGVEPFEDNGQPEEMPSLIVCDDDEDELADKENVVLKAEEPAENLNETFDSSPNDADKENVEMKKEKDKLDRNDTFNNSDCIIISPEQKRASTPNKPAKPPTSNKKVRINPDQMLNTPQQTGKAYRFPTPYKQKMELKFNVNAEKMDSDECEQFSTTLPMTTNCSIKDIVLRSIRKRSLSVCIDGKEEMRPKRALNRVYFHSPANQTANIDEVDLQMAKKHTQSCKKPPQKQNNVNLRRRRSMSVDDVRTLTVPKFFANKGTPSKQVTTPQKAAPNMRTKIPNFAAIHQKQFNKMENLAEHVARKAERAKILINSANKIKSVSAQKMAPASFGGSATKQQKSKASKRINLLNVDNEAKQTLKKTAAISIITTAAPVTDDIVQDWMQSAHLPRPTKKLFEATNAKGRVIPAKKVAPVAAAAPVAVTKKQPAAATATLSTLPKKALKPAQQLNLSAVPTATKPTFNLSTIYQPTKFNATTLDTTANTTASTQNLKEKMANRRQRHIEMFKGRCERVGTGTAAPSRRQAEIIRGVRSNRRFDLQMQHRRNLEQ